jgi:hypothetical protein
MGSNHNIDRDSQIPEGLEFRQEYLDKALAMYGDKKRMIWRRKLYTYASAAAIVVALVTGVVLSNKNSGQDVTQLNKTEVPAIDLGDNSAQAQKQDLKNNENVNEVGLSAEDGSQDQPQELYPQGTIDQSEMTSDQGDPTSSGVGSPDLKSSDKKKLNVNDDIAVETPKAKISLKKDGDVAKEVKKKANDAIQDDGAVVLSPSTTQQNSDDANPVIDSPAANHISYIGSIQLSASASELLNTHVIPVDKWERFHPYLAIGAVAIADYGTDKYFTKIDPYVSLGCDYALHHKLKFGAEINYYSVSGMSHPFTVEQTTYGQGYSTTSTTYITDKMYYVGVHPYVSRTFVGKHELGLGYSLNYLITGSNLVQTGVRNSFDDSEISSTRTKGFVDGFCSVNQVINLNYQYWLGTNKSIGLNFQYGLTDITKNTVFASQQFDRNSMISAYFRMNLK